MIELETGGYTVFEILSPFIKREKGSTSRRVFVTVWTWDKDKRKFWKWKITFHFQPFLYFLNKKRNW